MMFILMAGFVLGSWGNTFLRHRIAAFAGIMTYSLVFGVARYIVFMFLFSVNFNVYFLILTGKLASALFSEELIWFSGIASAFVDNIPFAATMIPIIKTLEVSTGVPLSTLAWSLAVGTDIGGSATPIGASANVVGISAAAQEGHFIGWGEYCKYSVPATILVLLISTICIYVRYC